MKKNTMATAIVAGLAGIAGIANISTAVNVNPDGVGQVLLYPYYTVNGNNSTVLSVVNTTSAGKAVKVRFLDARNSREVLDFNLYLSEFDVWTAAVFSLAATGPANITTSDTSCTVPGIESGIFLLPTLADGRRYYPFQTSFFTDFTAAGLNTASPTRTRDGYVELIEMGSIPTDSTFGSALTHVGGRPAACAALESAWLSTGVWTATAGAIDLEPPTGGLFGGAALVNVSDGTYINYNADAVDGFSASVLHTAPGSDRPNLTNANGATPGAVTSYVFDRGRLITSNWLTASGGGVNAVSAVFDREAVFNEYAVDPDLAASSEWIVTFPTRRYYVGSTTATAPFTVGFGTASTGAAGACERVSGRIYDREEDTFRIFNFSPSVGQTQICWEANPLWFQRTPQAATANSPIHGAPGATSTTIPLWTGVPTYLQLFGIIQQTFNNGWFWLGFYDENAINSAGIPTPLLRPALVETAPAAGTVADRYYGLPATGYWALRVENANARPGVQGFYGGAYPHRASRACFKGNYGTTPCD
ncbi:MAG: hypothetical protein U1F26_03110 [Lysobacterales bacterium]